MPARWTTQGKDRALAFATANPIVLGEDALGDVSGRLRSLGARFSECAFDFRALLSEYFALRGLLRVLRSQRLAMGSDRFVAVRNAASERLQLGLFLDEDLPRLLDLSHRGGCLTHPLHGIEVREVALLALLVVREAAFELAMLSLVCGGARLGGGELVGDRLAPTLQLGESRAEPSELSVQFIDHIVIGLQFQQRL